jgi:PAS domain S-box-containing protein
MLATHEGFWDMNLVTNTGCVSARWKEILGYSSGDAVQNFAALQDLVHPDDREAVMAAAAETISGNGRPFVTAMRLRHTDGRYVPVLARAAVARDAEGNPTRMVGTILDLTAHDRISRELRLVESRYHDIVEHSPQGIYQTTPAGQGLTVNAACARILGYATPEDLLASGLSAQSLYVDPGKRDDFTKELAAHGTVVGFEARMRRKDGSIIWVSNTARIVRDDTGEVRCFEGFLEDITLRKEAEQMKTDFVSFATHQLRTPLAGIKWMLELVEPLDLTSESASFVADARASADRLIALVNDLLEVSRLEGGRVAVRPVPLDLSTATAKVLAELQPLIKAKQLRVAVAYAENLPPAFMDTTLASEVIMNLLSNAVRYTPDGGSIVVEAHINGGMVEWSVRDSGIGIPLAAQRRLFEKFFRADNASVHHTEGTGLGLYIAKLIVERSGGCLTFESIEARGSTFRFTVPVATTATGAAPNAAVAA